MSVLIWIQIVLLSDSVSELIFLKKFILEKVSRPQQKQDKLPSMQRANLLIWVFNGHTDYFAVYVIHWVRTNSRFIMFWKQCRSRLHVAGQYLNCFTYMLMTGILTSIVFWENICHPNQHKCSDLILKNKAMSPEPNQVFILPQCYIHANLVPICH